MAIQFVTTQVNCVLLTSQIVPGVINDPELLHTIGESPIQAIQMPDLAVSAFPSGIQINYLQVQPGRFAMSVAQVGEFDPSGKWQTVARRACEVALQSQPAIGLGLNFLRSGTFDSGEARPTLHRLIDPALTERLETEDIKLETAGIKLFYPWRGWRVTLSLEPDANDSNKVIANSNFHKDTSDAEAIRTALATYNDAYDSFVAALDQVLRENEYASS